MPTSLRAESSSLRDTKNGLSVSVVLPALNEQDTVAGIVESIRDNLMMSDDRRPFGLVDELIVMDDSSTDGTAEVAARAGAKVVSVSDVLRECGPGSGKGNVLWKSVAATAGDIIVWIDADLTNFHPDFVTELVKPLLDDPSISMVKGFYQRPEIGGVGGGRTTEIMARPLISTFFPELAMIKQPLGGEYAARRSVVEKLPFCEGYGVETGLLIDIAAAEGVDSIGQVDLGTRHHRARPLHDLAAQSMEVLHAVLHRIPAGSDGLQLATVLTRPDRPEMQVKIGERPPLVTCEGYLKSR